MSGARSALRLMWFLDFVYFMLDALLKDSAVELKPAASKAYELALAPRHPWALRMTVGAAMMLLPSRNSFLSTLANGQPQEAVMHQMAAFVHVMNRVREELWAFYRAHKIQDLP